MNRGQLLTNFQSKIYSYKKGNSLEEQLGESVVSKTDQTPVLMSKYQKHLGALRKYQMFQTRIYFKLCLSDPRFNGVIKSHKYETCYPMWIIVSTAGNSPFAQYLVELICPAANKTKYKVTNSPSSVN